MLKVSFFWIVFLTGVLCLSHCTYCSAYEKAMSKFADDASSAAPLFTIRLKGIYEPLYYASKHDGFMLKAALQDPLPISWIHAK